MTSLFLLFLFPPLLRDALYGGDPSNSSPLSVGWCGCCVCAEQFGRTPLICSIRSGNIDCTEALLDAGANIGVVSDVRDGDILFFNSRLYEGLHSAHLLLVRSL